MDLMLDHSMAVTFLRVQLHPRNASDAQITIPKMKNIFSHLSLGTFSSMTVKIAQSKFQHQNNIIIFSVSRYLLPHHKLFYFLISNLPLCILNIQCVYFYIYFLQIKKQQTLIYLLGASIHFRKTDSLSVTLTRALGNQKVKRSRCDPLLSWSLVYQK